MRNQLVYDLPTRLFHWLFAGLFIIAYVIASTAEESPLFPWHMLAGLTLALLVLMRVVWGVIGTRHARFSDFSLSPRALFTYFKHLVSGEKQRWSGHNPASSWAALIMVGLAVALGVTGYLMASGGNTEVYEDIHELLANAFIAMVMLHVAGLVLHAVRYRDGLPLSMVDGCKQQVAEDESISSSRPVVGMLLLAIVAAFAVMLVRNYDTGTQTLNLFGNALLLGADEAGNPGEANESDAHHKTARDDDD